MYRRWRCPKESLEIRFRWNSAVDQHVVVDERQVLTLLLCESVCHSVHLFPDRTLGITWTKSRQAFGIRVNTFVYARHGRELMGCDSTVFDPAFDMSSGLM